MRGHLPRRDTYGQSQRSPVMTGSTVSHIRGKNLGPLADTEPTTKNITGKLTWQESDMKPTSPDGQMLVSDLNPQPSMLLVNSLDKSQTWSQPDLMVSLWSLRTADGKAAQAYQDIQTTDLTTAWIWCHLFFFSSQNTQVDKNTILKRYSNSGSATAAAIQHDHGGLPLIYENLGGCFYHSFPACAFLIF